jgi:hypothetical protein
MRVKADPDPQAHCKKKTNTRFKPKIQVSAARYKHFIDHLRNLAKEKNQAQAEIGDIRKYIAEKEKNQPFTEEELDVVLKRMDDDHRVFRSGNTVYLI